MQSLIKNRLLSIIAFVSIIFSVIIIAQTPYSNTYEISIYNVYPIYFWILLSIPISIAFLKVIIEEKSNYYTFTILGGALFSIFILLGLPFFRGYPFYGAGDTLTHLGMIKDIVISGHIGLHNPYPIIHLLIFSLSTISNLTPEKISLFIPTIFVFLFIISMFLLSKSLGYSKKESLFVMLFSIVPVLGTGLTTEYINPSLQAFLYIPFALFLFFKSRNSERKMEFSIILLISLFLIAFFHPEPLIYLTIFFVVLFFVSKFEKKLNQGFNKPNLSIQRISLPLSFLIVASLAWFSTTLVFGNSVFQIYNTFILNLQNTPPPIATLIGGFHISIVDVLSTIAKQYGIMLVYLIFGAFLVLYAIFKIILKKKITFLNLLLASIFSAFALTSLVFLTKGTSIGIQVLRPIKYPLLIATLILGIYFSTFIKNLNLKSISHVFIIIIFVFILPFIAITSTFPSPSMQEYNYEPTQSDIQGMSFFLDNRNNTIYATEVLPFAYQSRYADYLLGYEAKKTNLISGTNTTPPHFGYNSTNSEIGSYYKKSEYLLMYPPSLIYYPEIYPNYENLWIYTPSDFENLENNDKSVNSVYNNGKFQLFLINN
jgi:hypothetical protein